MAKTLTVTVASGGSATLAVSAGQIGVAGLDCGGATVTNTDTIVVNGNPGTTESLTVDQTGGALAPGATAESGGSAVSEIEIAVDLGDATDPVTIIGTAGDDSISAGTNGVSLNADNDVDMTFAVQPAALELRGGGGVNYLNARGGDGSGTLFAGRVVLVAGDNGDLLRGSLGDDELRGGAGNDVLEGREGNDVITGNGGDDQLAGSTGDDVLTGGLGADVLAGSDGDDILHADDDLADTTISGGPGVDTAYYDLGIDPNPGAVENKIPA